MSADIAQVIEAAQPRGEHTPVPYPILAGNSILLSLAHAAKQGRERSKVPDLAGDPDCQGQAVLGPVVSNKFFSGSPDQLGMFGQPVKVSRETGFLIQLDAEIIMEKILC